MSQLNPALNIAYKAARKAGDLMLRAANNLDSLRVDHKAANDSSPTSTARPKR